MTLELTFWGVRGTNPVSGKEYEKIGGHTSCVSVLVDQQHLIVFDGGSGLYDLGKWMKTTSIKTIHLFFSHLHLDHVMGLPFFGPLWDKSYTLHFYSPKKDLKEFLESTLFHHPLFPVPMTLGGSSLSFQVLDVTQEIHITKEIVIKMCPLNHPGSAVGYRLDTAKASICYITDVEHDPAQLDQDLIQFIKGSNLFIYDSAYTEEEYEQKQGWGHSTHIRAAELAKAADVQQLALFHHDPAHTDTITAHVESEAQAIFKDTFAARQGLVLTF